jgi:hypothetical protein
MKEGFQLAAMQAGLSYAAAVTIVMVLDVPRRLCVFFRYHPKEWSMTQRRRVDVNGDKKLVLSQIHSKLLRMKYIRDVSVDGYRIRARTSARRFTFGERIQVSLYNVSGGSTRVVISSEPAMNSALIDFGQSIINVEKLSRDLFGDSVGMVQD